MGRQQASKCFGIAVKRLLEARLECVNRWFSIDHTVLTYQHKDDSHRTLLHLALWAHDRELCERVLQDTSMKPYLNVELRDSGGYTLLPHALLDGSVLIVILNQVQNDNGCVPLSTNWRCTTVGANAR